MRRLFALSVVGLLAGCDNGQVGAAREAVAPNPANDVQVVSVSKVGLSVLEMPNARVRVKNTGSATLRTVHVKCLFTDAKGQDMGDGLALFWNLSPGAEDIADAQGGEQYQRPAKADCRVQFAHE